MFQSLMLTKSFTKAKVTLNINNDVCSHVTRSLTDRELTYTYMSSFSGLLTCKSDISINSSKCVILIFKIYKCKLSYKPFSSLCLKE